MHTFGSQFYILKSLQMKNEKKSDLTPVEEATGAIPPTVGHLDGIDDQENPLKFEPDTDEYGDRMPYVGETVLFRSNPDDKVAKANNNEDPIAAIVTRVWSNVCVNLKIIPDCGPMQDRTSVVRKDANPAGYHFQYID